MLQRTCDVGQRLEAHGGRTARERVRQRLGLLGHGLVPFKRPFREYRAQAARPFIGLVEIDVIELEPDAQRTNDTGLLVRRRLGIESESGFGARHGLIWRCHLRWNFGNGLPFRQGCRSRNRLNEFGEFHRSRCFRFGGRTGIGGQGLEAAEIDVGQQWLAGQGLRGRLDGLVQQRKRIGVHKIGRRQCPHAAVRRHVVCRGLRIRIAGGLVLRLRGFVDRW